MLIRALEDEGYPYAGRITDYAKHPPWKVFNYLGPTYAGLKFEIAKHFAFLDDAGSAWDAALTHNDSLHAGDDPWNDATDGWTIRTAIWNEWNAFPEANRAWMTISGVVPYESLIEIDGEGDDVARMPHLIVDFSPRCGPFSGTRAKVVASGLAGAPARKLAPENSRDGRLTVFPIPMRTKENQ